MYNRGRAFTMTSLEDNILVNMTWRGEAPNVSISVAAAEAVAVSLGRGTLHSRVHLVFYWPHIKMGFCKIFKLEGHYDYTLSVPQSVFETRSVRCYWLVGGKAILFDLDRLLCCGLRTSYTPEHQLCLRLAGIWFSACSNPFSGLQCAQCSSL